MIKLDPKLKNRIEKNDVQRSIRFYEIKYHTKKSILDWFKKTKKIFSNDEFLKLYINHPREELIKRINKRVDEMFKEGAIKEVTKFNQLKSKKTNSSNKIIGIREISDFLRKKSNLNQAKDLISIKTRQYAKRQVTWSRSHMQSWYKIDPKSINSFLKNFKF